MIIFLIQINTLTIWGLTMNNTANNSQEILITSAVKPLFYKNFNEIDFSGLKNNHYYDRHFISSEGIQFEDHIDNHYYTAAQLVFYPELALKLRELKDDDYPTLKRTYKIDENLKGMEFIEHFYETTKKSYAIFLKVYEEACTEMNALLKKYGRKRQTPIITAFEKNAEGHCSSRSCSVFINDVRWEMGDSPAGTKITEYLNMRYFLNVSHEYEMLKIADVKIGSPFLALRLGKTWRHKGHVQWFDLDTGQPVSKSKLHCP